MLRTPLLPLTAFTAWITDAHGTSAEELRSTLRRWVEQPSVADALGVASTALAEGMNAWRERPDSPAGQAVECALVRYFARMAGRSTPFGLFSGVTPGQLGERTDLQLTGGHTRRTRLDNGYLFRLVATLSADPQLRCELTYRPNTSLYPAGGRIRYAESLPTKAGPCHRLVAIEPSPYLTTVLERARQGARRDELARILIAEDEEIELADAEGFIDELIAEQVLVSDLELPVTGPEPIDGITAELGRTAAGAGTADVLATVASALRALDGDGLGVPARRYDAVAQLLEPFGVPMERSRLLQVDLVREASATVGNDVADDVLAAVRVLHRFSAGNPHGGLERFRNDFAERYEDREVPLMEALDADVGVGFEPDGAIGRDVAPLLEGLAFGRAPEDGAQRLTRAHAWLLRRLAQLPPEATVLELIEADIAQMEPGGERPPLPDAFVTVVTLRRGAPRIVLHGGAWGPSGARISGRFCHASDEIARSVSEHLRAEEALCPDAVFAEVVHLSEGRVGNILCRPVLRDYEIPLLGRSGAPEHKRLGLDDLRVSVRGDRIVLRSHRLDREVIPRLSTAHNFDARTIPAYRFLCALQSQGSASCAFAWGPLGALPFLPRVQYGDVVFSPATWRLDEEALRPWTDTVRGKPASEDETRRRRQRAFEAAQRLRTAHRLPRYALLVDRDNKLPIDFDNLLSVYSAAMVAKSRREAVFEEFPCDPDEAIVRGPDGLHAHELTLSFVRREPRPRPSRGPRSGAAVPREFDPGTSWLYAKIYAGPSDQDALLQEVAARVCEVGRRTGAVDRWFFLRYRDPAPHLRLRWHGDPARLRSEVLEELRATLQPWRQSGAVWKLQLDTYAREVERYGGPAGIELSEQIFCADSDAALQLLAGLSDAGGEDARWRLALLGVDALLADFGLDEAMRLDVLTRMRDGFFREFFGDAALKRQLGKRFRGERAWLDAALHDGVPLPQDGLQPPAHAALRRRTAALRPCIADLMARQGRGELDAPVLELVPSYAHMHCNRVLRSAHRAHELVIYDLLARHYTSRIAQARRRR